MKRVPIYARIKLPSGEWNYQKAPDKRFRPIAGTAYYLRVEGKYHRVDSTDAAVIIAAQKREEARLNAIAAGAIPKPVVNPKGSTIRESIDTFLNEKVRPWSTMRAYTRALNAFADFTDAKYPAEITKSHVLSFYKTLKGSVRTRNNTTLVLRSWMRSQGLTWVLTKGDLAKPTKKKPPVYQEHQLERLLAAATRDEHDFVMFLLQTGTREKEAQYAMYSDLIGGKWVVKQKAAYPAFVIKDKEEREIPVPSSFIAMLQARKERYPGNRLIFPTEDGRPDGHLLRRIKNLAFKAGANCGECVGKDGQRCSTAPCCSKYTLHSFRRTYATRLHKHGVPVSTIRDYLGHADIKTTELYGAAYQFPIISGPRLLCCAKCIIDTVNLTHL